MALKQIVWCLAALILVLGVGGSPARAQGNTGALCIETFADLNADGVKQPDEVYLPGVNVNLATGGAIIATHVTAQDETSYCF